MSKYYLLSFSLLSVVLSTSTFAQKTITYSNSVQTEIPTPPINSQRSDYESPDVSSTDKIQEALQADAITLRNISIDELKGNVNLAEKALNLALINQNWAAIKEILPIYKSFSGTDKVLIDYAQGALYREQQDYKKAISVYRKLISEHPEMERVRLDLALLLFADHQDTAAKDQFIKIRSNPQNDQALNNIIDQYIKRIDQRSSWQLNAGLSYIQDNNVNNASKSETILLNGLSFKKEKSYLPQKAHGFDFSLGLGRDFNISSSNYLSIDIDSYGKIYWDNHDFDDASIRLSTGYKYKDSRNNLSILPFSKWRYVGGDPYSNTLGFSVNASRWLSPNWQISTYNELGFEKSLVKGNKDKPSERQLFASANALWAPKSTQYFTLGGSVFDVKGESKAVSSTRYGLNTSWNQDWGLGVSSKVNLGVGRKVYKGTHYLGVTRKDNDLNAGLTLWNRDWHVWGITPKLSFRYNKVDSNIDDLYSYDKGTVFLQFDKTL